MKWKIKVETRLKKSIFDPQGQAVKSGLQALGFANLSAVHVGKYLEFIVEEDSGREAVSSQVDEMCRRLLANPVIEDYNFQLEEMEG